jgi:FkbM family methyltransferase
MNEHDLVKDTLDWFLPLKHEAAYTGAFMQGGRTFIDIGAHVGSWTLRLAPLFQRVICFEPDPRGFTALRKNIDLAGLTNVEVIGAAVSDKNGTAVLTLYPNPCTNTMLPSETGRVDQPLMGIEVPTVSIDEFVAERGITDIDFIKMDAEGAEMMIVPGALETLRTQRPDFFIELHGLFWRRLRAMMPWQECDVIDGGRCGLSLVRHRDAWPEFQMPDFRVYPHPSEPTAQDHEELRRAHGVPEEYCKPPTSGFLSVEGV